MFHGVTDNPTIRVALATSMCVCLLVAGCSKGKSTPAPHASVVVDEPTPSPVDPYVGSNACVDCHEEISRSYRTHSMAKSAALLDSSVELPNVAAANFESGSFRYAVHKQGDNWVHHQGRVGKDGTEIANVDLPVQHVIGSGNHGQSFLVERDGYLFMSPITWYPDDGVWDLSPGYETNNSQFNRPVIEECLYCHTDGARAVPDTLNQYESPPMRGHTIGCERCHGPGRDHVEFHAGSEDASDSIVNPAKLSPGLRGAVCQQCHLSGAVRVTKQGKTLNDYRPGERLESAYTVFTMASTDEQEQFVGHVEQMHASTCFKSTDGRLGCISCHDPHQLPAPDQVQTYYRQRCLTCHEEESCSEALTVRRETTVEDNCVVCHMPRRPTEIRHAAVTDHSIPRFHNEIAPKANPTQLVAFPSNAVAQPSKRDKAIALVRVGSRHPNTFASLQLDDAQRALEAAVAADPTDHDASEALADLYLASNDYENALRICRSVLAQAPRREQTLTIAAEILSNLQNFGQAIPYWEQAIKVNPWMSKYWYKLGQAYAGTGQWFLCRRIASGAKERFPTSIGVRHLLMQSSFALQDPETAEREFREIENFSPRGLESLRRWYQSHLNAQ